MSVLLPEGFEWVDAPGGPALVCQPLHRIAPHFFTTRSWVLGTRDANGGTDQAWAQVAAAMNLPPSRLLRLRQVHGDAVVVHRRGDALPAPPREADIILTDDPDVALAVQTADCVPLLLADPRSGAVAAAHAGWRGLAAGVPGVAVAAMTRAFGSRPHDLVAALGPSISAARYEVGDEVRARFEASGVTAPALEAWFPVRTRPGHWLFDGWRAASDRLLAAGVPADHVHASALCTAEHADLLCSYRRDNRAAGRMAAVIRRQSTDISRQTSVGRTTDDQ
jgi:polyphenol oxidase